MKLKPLKITEDHPILRQDQLLLTPLATSIEESKESTIINDIGSLELVIKNQVDQVLNQKFITWAEKIQSLVHSLNIESLSQLTFFLTTLKLEISENSPLELTASKDNKITTNLVLNEAILEKIKQLEVAINFFEKINSVIKDAKLKRNHLSTKIRDAEMQKEEAYALIKTIEDPANTSNTSIKIEDIEAQIQSSETRIQRFQPRLNKNTDFEKNLLTQIEQITKEPSGNLANLNEKIKELLVNLKKSNISATEINKILSNSSDFKISIRTPYTIEKPPKTPEKGTPTPPYKEQVDTVKIAVPTINNPNTVSTTLKTGSALKISDILHLLTILILSGSLECNSPRGYKKNTTLKTSTLTSPLENYTLCDDAHCSDLETVPYDYHGPIQHAVTTVITEHLKILGNGLSCHHAQPFGSENITPEGQLIKPILLKSKFTHEGQEYSIETLMIDYKQTYLQKDNPKIRNIKIDHETNHLTPENFVSRTVTVKTTFIKGGQREEIFKTFSIETNISEPSKFEHSITNFNNKSLY